MIKKFVVKNKHKKKSFIILPTCIKAKIKEKYTNKR